MNTYIRTQLLNTQTVETRIVTPTTKDKVQIIIHIIIYNSIKRKVSLTHYSTSGSKNQSQNLNHPCITSHAGCTWLRHCTLVSLTLDRPN